MKRIFTLIFLLSLVFHLSAQQHIRVTDFGAKPSSGEDTRLAFQRAVEGLHFVGNRLRPTVDYEPFLWQRSNLWLDGCRNVVVEGNKVHRRFPAKTVEMHHMVNSDVEIEDKEFWLEIK